MTSAADATLTDIHASLWAALARAAADRRDPWHLITIATIAIADDTTPYPDARTVVLRKADPDRRTILAHTDRRTEKAAHINTTPRCAVLAYDPSARQQVRMRARATIHTQGPLFERQWQATKLMSRRCYLAPLPPGTPADGPIPNIPEDLLHTEPDQQRSELARDNFAVIECTIEHIDWIHLAHDGHRRAAFTYDLDHPAAEPHSTWLAP